MAQDKAVKTNQNIILENRRSLSISGITDVTALMKRRYACIPSWGS